MNRRDRKSPLFIFLFLHCWLCFTVQALTGADATIISNDSIASVMEELEKQSITNTYPIYRVYVFSSGAFKDYVLLTEHPYDTNGSVILNDSIHAFCIRITDGKYMQKWSLKDFIIKSSNNDVEEKSIWFWSKYIRIKDIDHDGETDFIIVYGTQGINNIDDGRLKILVYHKGLKSGIRHQNGVLDFERQTQIDGSFYSLPKSIQESVISLIESIIKDGHAVFATYWKKSFENKRLLITEANQELPPKQK